MNPGRFTRWNDKQNDRFANPPDSASTLASRCLGTAAHSVPPDQAPNSFIGQAERNGAWSIVDDVGPSLPQDGR
jgi:hypothetical protein